MHRMKERKRQKLARMEGSVDEIQETTAFADETITKLSELEKLYEEKKKVKILFIVITVQHLPCYSPDAALLYSVKQKTADTLFHYNY